jgi:hypothetical protein
MKERRSSRIAGKNYTHTDSTQRRGRRCGTSWSIPSPAIATMLGVHSNRRANPALSGRVFPAQISGQATKSNDDLFCGNVAERVSQIKSFAAAWPTFSPCAVHVLQVSTMQPQRPRPGRFMRGYRFALTLRIARTPRAAFSLALRGFLQSSTMFT